MPNWCFTNITLNCKSNDVAKRVHDKIDQWTSTNAIENGFGENWLGNVLINSGCRKGEEINTTNCPRCRGDIVWLDVSENQVNIQTETAWSPMMEMWREVCEKAFPEEDIEIIYTSEETGMWEFYTNDPYYRDKYIFSNGNHIEYEETEDGVREILLAHVPVGFRTSCFCMDVKTLLDIVRERYLEEDEILDATPYKFLSIEELGM